MTELFLDANAHLPLHPKALQAYFQFHQSMAGHGHPSSISAPGRAAAVAYEAARQKIASLVGAKSAGQIIFTSGCTQAVDWGLEIFFKKYINDCPKIITSPIEHPSVRENFEKKYREYSPKTFGIAADEKEINYLNVKNTGIIDTEQFFNYEIGCRFSKKYHDKVCCIHMHNEIGTVQDIKNFNKEYLFSDMSQSLGKIPVDVTDLNVDIAVFGAHKFGGPGSFGFMYLKNIQDWTHFGDGSRYFTDRPGTPDVAGAVATAIALEEAVSSLEERTRNMIEFQSMVEDFLEKKEFEIIGKNVLRSPNTTFVSMPGKGLETLISLGEHQIYTGLGSACGSFHTGDSPTIKSLGRCGGVHDFLRISQFGEYGGKEAKHFITTMEKIL